MIDLTIVIVSYETCDLLGACLESIRQARLAHPELEVETLVVDNGSRDGSVALALDSPVRARVLALVLNRGFAVAVNLALRVRRGRQVLLLNSDVELETDVLARGVALLDEFSDVAVLGVGLVHSDGRPQRSVHAFPGLQTELIPEPLLRLIRRQGYSARTGSAPNSQGLSLREVEAVRGAVFFLRGDLLEKVGLLDEGYFFFLEETDYCWRVRAAGYRVVHCEGLRASHRLGASSKLRAPLATRVEFHRSLYRFLDRRRGRTVAAVARAVRTLRNAVSLIGLGVLAAGSSRARDLLGARWGLLLWHLRGCPLQPSLERADSGLVARGGWRRERRA